MKKKNVLALVLFLFAVVIWFTPATSFAYQCSDGSDNDNDGTIDFTGFGSSPMDPGCSSATDDDEKDAGSVTTDLSFKIQNPLQHDIDTLPKFINKLVEIFLMIGTPIVALMIIYAGFLFVVARGNSEAIEKAKKTLGFTLLGAAILLGAFVISTAIQDTITNISSESMSTAP